MDDFAIDWQAESLRMTAFPMPAAAPTELPNWWEELFGTEAPDSEYRRRRRSLHEAGPLENGLLSLTVQPSRINWVFSEFESDEDSFRNRPLIQPFEAAMNIFLPVMRQWLGLDTRPTLHRLAFGVVLLYPVEDKVTGYRQLAGFLPNVQLDPENMSDFLFQVNRPRNTTTSVENLTINRLSKWSVATFQNVEFRLNQLPASVASEYEFSACRLELDINTSQYFTDELPPDQLTEIFTELVTLAQETIESGDTP